MTKSSIFRTQNPNNQIFRIQTEEGPDGLDTDSMSPMIGDSTLKHVDSLSSSHRMLWEHFICMTDGNLFEMVENTRSDEDDEFFLRGKTSEEIDFIVSKAPEKIKILVELQAEEEKRRMESEDVYDKGSLIPYSEWENFPQLMSHWDTKPTPRPRGRYVGTCRNRFMDYWPSAHPNENELRVLIALLDKPSNFLTSSYIHRIAGKDREFPHYWNYVMWLVNIWQNFGKVTQHLANKMVMVIKQVALGPNDPDEVIISFLEEQDEILSASLYQA